MDKVEEDENRRGCSQRKPILDRILTKFDSQKVKATRDPISSYFLT